MPIKKVLPINTPIFSPEFYIKKALSNVITSTNVPVGAILVYKENIISEHINGTMPLEHAEFLCLQEGYNKLKHEIQNAILYVTLEPCDMCKAAISLSGLKTVYFGAYNEKSIITPSTNFYGGFCEQESAEIIKVFFKNKR